MGNQVGLQAPEAGVAAPGAERGQGGGRGVAQTRAMCVSCLAGCAMAPGPLPLAGRPQCPAPGAIRPTAHAWPSAGASFLPPNARNPLAAPSGVRGGLQGGGSSSESAPLLGGGGGGGQQAQALLAAPQDQYLSSRAEALHQVESTIVELGSIFQQLAHMVHEQGEMAMRIDENVDDALANVDAGQAQLLKYLNAISSNRMLLLKVFAVLLAFMVFFIMFIA